MSIQYKMRNMQDAKLIVYTEPMSIGRRIRDARKDLGLSQGQLAKALATSQANVSRWEGDRVRPPDNIIIQLATTLKKSASFLTFGQNEDTISVHAEAALPQTRIIGRVEAGAWRDGLFDESKTRSIRFAPHPAFSVSKQKAFEISGSSCNRIVRSGGHAIVVDYADFPGGIDALTMRSSPPLVIVERERAGAFEYTMKELHVRGGSLVLMPASDDPAHQDEIIVDPKGDTNLARIAFVVIQVVNQVI